MADLESKLTGEKTISYISDSDEDADNDGKETSVAENIDAPYDGPQTGPKGVLADYKQYKNLCRIEDLKAAKEQIDFHKKKAFTADPNKHPDKKEKEESDDEFDFEDDEFLQEYHHKRLEQMRKEMEDKIKQNMVAFGSLYELQSSEELLDTIDKEEKNVIVIIHLYDQSVQACVKLNECLDQLAKQYTHVKFCKILTTKAGLSLQFKLSALPALQVYKSGSLIGNYIKMQDHLDKIFYTADVENFLIESDIIPSTQNIRNNYDDFDIVDDDDDE